MSALPPPAKRGAAPPPPTAQAAVSSDPPARPIGRQTRLLRCRSWPPRLPESRDRREPPERNASPICAAYRPAPSISVAPPPPIADARPEQAPVPIAPPPTAHQTTLHVSSTFWAPSPPQQPEYFAPPDRAKTN